MFKNKLIRNLLIILAVFIVAVLIFVSIIYISHRHQIQKENAMREMIRTDCHREIPNKEGDAESIFNLVFGSCYIPAYCELGDHVSVDSYRCDCTDECDSGKFGTSTCITEMGWICEVWI